MVLILHYDQHSNFSHLLGHSLQPCLLKDRLVDPIGYAMALWAVLVRYTSYYTEHLFEAKSCCNHLIFDLLWLFNVPILRCQ